MAFGLARAVAIRAATSSSWVRATSCSACSGSGMCSFLAARPIKQSKQRLLDFGPQIYCGRKKVYGNPNRADHCSTNATKRSVWLRDSTGLQNGELDGSGIIGLDGIGLLQRGKVVSFVHSRRRYENQLLGLSFESKFRDEYGPKLEDSGRIYIRSFSDADSNRSICNAFRPIVHDNVWFEVAKKCL